MNKKIKKYPTSVPYDDVLMKMLKNNEPEQIGYIQAALEDCTDFPDVILAVLRDVARARGFQKFAKQAKLNRETLYRTLSKNGNPTLNTINKMLNALNLKLKVVPKTKVG